VLGLLGLVPGMPNFIFLFFTVALAGFAWMLSRREARKQAAEQKEAPAPAQEAPEATWDDVQLIDVLGLEVGHRLIPLVDFHQQGELLGRIKGVRKKFAQEMGFLPPVVHIRDNLELGANAYVVTLKGARIGSGSVFPGRWMAIDPGQVSGQIKGDATTDPAFGLPATWIDADQREQAQIFGYTVVDAATVVATHLNHLLHLHAGAMLGRKEVQKLLDKVGDENKALVEDVIPKIVPLAILQRLLQNLLDEAVSIRDMRTILDTLAEHAGDKPDVNALTTRVRVALGRAITDQWFDPGKELHVIGLDTQLEQVLDQAINGGGAMEPGLADTLIQESTRALTHQEAVGEPNVLVVPPALRPLLARFLRRRLPQLAVMSHAEIPDDRGLRVTSLIGAAR
jgi:flagellar biosynthesis protein FlhA